MQKLSSLFIVSLIIIQTFYNLGVTVYWLSNHQYIAKVLCENRDKAYLHCDGKCYLMRKMAAAHQDSGPAGQSFPKSLKKSLEVYEFPDGPCLIGIESPQSSNQLIPTIPGCCSVEAIEQIFRPPASRVA
jgi:hypothetical protein